MVFGFLRRKKSVKEKREEEMAGRHPFDRAATEINDALADLKKTTEQIEDEQARKEAIEQLKRLKV